MFINICKFSYISHLGLITQMAIFALFKAMELDRLNEEKQKIQIVLAEDRGR